MPVTFQHAAVTAYAAATTSVNFLATAPSDTVLLVFTNSDTGGASVSSMTYAGLSLTKLALNGNGLRQEVWGLTAPPAGAGTLSSAHLNSLQRRFLACFYANATAASPFGAAYTTTAGAVTNFNMTLSASNADNTFVLGIRSQEFTSNNGNVRASVTASAVSLTLVDMPGDSTTFSATCASGFVWLGVGVLLNYSATAGGSPATLFGFAALGVGR